MLLALGKTQNFADRLKQAIPPGLFGTQPILPSSREAVDSRSPIVLGDSPFGRDPARLFHAMKRRIERSLLDPQCVICDLLDARRDAVPVQWSPTQRLQNKKIEGSLERIRLLRLSPHT
jgi:hypothetical protein